MFESLTESLSGVFDKLTKRGILKEEDVTAALREVRIVLLEADVALPVVKDFVARIKARAVGREVLKSVAPGQQVVKIVNDEMVAMLGGEAEDLNLAAAPPAVILMVGLQGSGKTTTTAKIAKRLVERNKKTILMASLDVRRPAAQEQLKVLGEQIDVATLPVVAGQMPVDIAARAISAARLQGADIVLLDTAGRMHVDQGMMAEVAAIKAASNPVETLLVADSLTGQDAVNVARAFDQQVGVTGIILTRMDGDGRGGAALSMRAVTGKPIKLIGTGEKLDAIEIFHPSRIASRILGMGDVVSLVEKAAETIEQEDAERLAKKMQAGKFDLDDLRAQLRQMMKMGGMQGLLSMLPGVGKMKNQMAGAGLDDKALKRQEAIINSMTPKERRHAKILNASRKRRLAAGSGTTIQEVNRLLKMHKQMGSMMKRMKKMGSKGMLPPGAMPPGMGHLLPKK
ncbi:MAG: signal recognition particle protein [Proteobacteria bacterium]|nr:signal recognition particle protein [Pseudomonadota bacterium]